ncbi:hypothetical protein [Aeropyrum globular virus 1]|uniref:hypothetical protein n=1 Tax=Aeropyrum globular virus 1 TaxID=1932713 RepID=UPI000C7EE343|nr:hypothetical protein C1186_gp03 [Aeropyrum globular virus 1]BBC20929.1 hypothetical protein [Aeropyrum globular virus 1]
MLLLVAILASVVLPSVAVASAEDPLPLEWGDTGKELPPGYRVTALTHGIAVAIGGLSGFADAVACVGDYCFGLVGDDGIIPVHVNLFIAGETREIDTLWQGMAEYDADWAFTLHCPGESIGGLEPGPEEAVLEVESSQYGIKRYYLVDLSQGVSPDLKYFYESTPGVTSWVEFTDPEKVKDCGGDYQGEPPSGGEGNRPQGGGLLDLNMTVDLTWLALGLVAVGFLLILLKRW